MGWKKCTKEQHWDAVYNGNDNIVSSHPDYSIWTTRNGTPVAKSSAGYVPNQGPEKFYIWENDND